MFDSIYSKAVTPSQFLIMTAATLVSGILFSWLMSFRIRAKSRFFIVTSILPFVVGMVSSLRPCMSYHAPASLCIVHCALCIDVVSPSKSITKLRAFCSPSLAGT